MNKNYLIDMDGVLVHGKKMVPGADSFIERLKAHECRFLILTNNSLYTPGDLSHLLKSTGLDIPKQCIFTSAMATALFLARQTPTVQAESSNRWLLSNLSQK